MFSLSESLNRVFTPVDRAFGKFYPLAIAVGGVATGLAFHFGGAVYAAIPATVLAVGFVRDTARRIKRWLATPEVEEEREVIPAPSAPEESLEPLSPEEEMMRKDAGMSLQEWQEVVNDDSPDEEEEPVLRPVPPQPITLVDPRQALAPAPADLGLPPIPRGMLVARSGRLVAAWEKRQIAAWAEENLLPLATATQANIFRQTARSLRSGGGNAKHLIACIGRIYFDLYRKQGFEVLDTLPGDVAALNNFKTREEAQAEKLAS